MDNSKIIKITIFALIAIGAYWLLYRMTHFAGSDTGTTDIAL